MLNVAISGLNAARKGIDVSSNNVSNGATVGFKSSSTFFADVFPNDPSSSPKTAVGAGAITSSVVKNMSQGSVSSSGKVTDLAITGNGFFVLGSGTSQSNNSTISAYPMINAGTVTSGYTSYLTPTYVDPNLTIKGTGTIDSVNVVISNVDPDDKLIFTGYKNIKFDSYDSTTGVLRISGSGSLDDYQNALRQVQFQTSSNAKSGIRNINFNLGTAIQGPNGHYYDILPTKTDWNTAKTNAEKSSYYGMTGYLATVTSQAENDFIAQKLNTDSWMGGSDNYQAINAALGFQKYPNQAAAEGNWYWVTGPEAGTPFFIGTGSNPTTLTYANFSAGEPNNYNGNEDSTEMFASGGGHWNDLLANQFSLPAVIEYNGDPSLKITSSTTINVGANQPIIPVQTASKGSTSTSTEVFTRAGDFNLDKDGYIISSIGLKLQGYDLLSANLSKTSIKIPFNNGTVDGVLQNLSINSEGVVSANYAGQTSPLALFQICIAGFPNATSLKAIGNTCFMSSGESGDATYGKPGDPGYGSILSGSLEESNVDMTSELVKLIKYQQIYNGNARSLQTMTEVASRVTDKL